MPPALSILLPAHDAETTLDVCLRSVTRQRETDFECIVVDDGSRDATRNIAEQAARRDPRIRLISTPHRGLVDALAIGLEACRGGLVARMDADDWMHRDRLALQRRALERDDSLAAVGCHVRSFPRSALSDGRRAYDAWLCSIGDARALRRDAFIECPIAHPTFMARRAVLEAHAYRDVAWAEDYDLLLRWLAAGYEVGVVPRRLHGWRDAPDRLSRTHARYAPSRFTACKAHYLASGLLADSPDYVLWGHGATGRALRRALEAHGRRPSHIVEVHPRRLGKRIHGAAVVDPGWLRGGPGGAPDGTARTPLVVSVSGPGPRAEIRAALAEMGYVETRDYVCAA